MISIIIFAITLLIFYYLNDISDYIISDDLKNYSKTSTPLLKNGFAYAFMSQGEKF
jgi:hypothetical protein